MEKRHSFQKAVLGKTGQLYVKEQDQTIPYRQQFLRQQFPYTIYKSKLKMD